MRKLALKDAYFSVLLEKNSRQFICFRWSRNLYKFLCLCFGLEPAPQIFTKLLKVPMTILHRININIIIHLDNMLLICHSLEDTHKSRHSNLPSATSRICHKLQKFCIDTSARNRVFGPNKKLCHYRTFFKQNKNSESCFRISEFVKKPTNINSGVDKVDWMLTSTIQAVLPARLNCCFLQRQQISFSEKNCFE